MPHSSGGGSHGGGSHGGSHHSGGGSSSNNRKHSSTYFSGARHYVYYKNKKPVHFYSDVEITPEYIAKRKKQWKIIKTGLIIAYAFIYLMIFFNSVLVVPHKLKKACEDTNRLIDELAIFSSTQEAKLIKQLEEFRDLTGISVTILTVYDEAWTGNYTSLENYAYDYYVTNLSDEKNWLIVYSESAYYTTFNNWKWEGMQGDDTDRILTPTSTNKFNKVMHKNISKNGFAEAAIQTFDYYNDIVMTTQFSIGVLVSSIFAVAMHGGIFFFVFWSMYGAAIKIDEKAVELENPQATYIEEACEFCRGVYIHGIHTSCPHCGAPVSVVDNEFREEQV